MSTGLSTKRVTLIHTSLLQGIWGHLRTRRRIQLGVLLLVMLASGGSELVSLGAAIPFLVMLSNPEPIWKQHLVQVVAPLLGFNEGDLLLLPATMAFVAAAVLAAMIRLLNLWLNGRLAAAVGSDLSCEAYRHSLSAIRGAWLRNSSELITGTTTQITLTVVAINALLQLITSFGGYRLAYRFAFDRCTCCYGCSCIVR